ncbi:hypothetical protein [Enterococcus gilvus]|uniref:hypothetical protein n=1 Tax=Enterococcus gilvus TaxID=160453 RepID=UPI003EDACB0A
MKELYFPTISVRQDNWLKYALLYKEKLYTIKPTAYSLPKGYEINERIGEEFLLPYDPEQYMNIRDTRNNNFEEIVIKYLNEINRNKESFPIKITNGKQRQFRNQVFLDDEFRNAPKNSLLFRGKYTPEIETFLVDTGYGVVTPDRSSIAVSNRFVIVYMGLLAELIANVDDSVVFTTKERRRREYVGNSRILNGGMNYRIWNEVSFGEAPEKYLREIVSLFLPDNIEDISIKSIGKLRQKSDYQKHLKRFNSTIKKLYVRSFNAKSREELLIELLDIREFFKSTISSTVGKDAFGFGFNAVLNLSHCPFLMSEGINYVISEKLDSFSRNHNNFISPLEGRSTLKFISNLDSLQPY